MAANIPVLNRQLTDCDVRALCCFRVILRKKCFVLSVYSYFLMMLSAPVSYRSRNNDQHRHSKAKPFCKCWNVRTPIEWKLLSPCCCGEDNDLREWKWEQPELTMSSWVVVSEDQKEVMFHPSYSSGTAAVKGDSPLVHNHHYYWEVKMLTETYGTDIMIGIGTEKVNIAEFQFKFTSLLGEDAESYGLSYKGAVRHNSIVANDSVGFCRGTIIGVRVDMWRGTLEYYVNRKPQGISFYNLRRHQLLYPMVCSTAAQSSMRLIYASSWQASLMVDAAKILAASVKGDNRPRLPPGLWHRLRSQFWLTLPTEGCVLEDGEEKESMEIDAVRLSTNMPLSSGVKRRREDDVVKLRRPVASSFS